VHLHDGSIERDYLDAHAQDLRLLQRLEHSIEHAAPGPAVHARIDRVPLVKTRGQAAPLAAVLSDVQERVEDLKVGQTDLALLTRQEISVRTVLE
jgi:hypothetical protein